MSDWHKDGLTSTRFRIEEYTLIRQIHIIYAIHVIFIICELGFRLAGGTEIIVSLVGNTTEVMKYKMYNKAIFLRYIGFTDMTGLGGLPKFKDLYSLPCWSLCPGASGACALSQKSKILLWSLWGLCPAGACPKNPKSQKGDVVFYYFLDSSSQPGLGGPTHSPQNRTPPPLPPLPECFIHL